MLYELLSKPLGNLTQANLNGIINYMDILNLAKSIIKNAGTQGKNFATGYMSLPDQSEQMQKLGGAAAIGHIAANALPPQSGVGGVDDAIRIMSPGVAQTASKLSPEFQELLKVRGEALKRLDLAKKIGSSSNVIKNLENNYYNIIKTMLKTK